MNSFLPLQFPDIHDHLNLEQNGNCFDNFLTSEKMEKRSFNQYFMVYANQQLKDFWIEPFFIGLVSNMEPRLHSRYYLTSSVLLSPQILLSDKGKRSSR